MRQLTERQKNAIDKWIKDNPTHGQATAFDAFPAQLYLEIEKMNEHETFHQNFRRYLEDNVKPVDYFGGGW